MINPYNNCILRKIIFFQYLPTSIGLVDQMGASFESFRGCNSTYRLRYWNASRTSKVTSPLLVATVLTACGIETFHLPSLHEVESSLLQQYLPLAVLKLNIFDLFVIRTDIVATVLTACGIETVDYPLSPCTSIGCNSTYRLWYWNSLDAFSVRVLKASCNSTYRLRYATKGARHRGAKRRWGPHISSPCLKGRENKGDDGIILTVYGMRRRVRGSRGAKRRWGPHISSPWLKGRENKGDEVTVLTACGIETLLQQ